MKIKIIITLLSIISSTTLPIGERGTLMVDEVPIVNSAALPSPLATTNVRLITVYLPPGFDASSDKRFPVIYYIPGLGGTNFTFTLGNRNLLDNLICNNEIAPVIVVHVDPSLVDGIDPQDGKRRYLGTWYVNGELNGDFEDFMVLDLIPFVDANYPTLPSRDFRAIMGQSMGGYGSVFLGMRHPELFSGFGSASGTTFWTLVTVLEQIIPGDIIIPPPGDIMFVMNSFIIPEIPTSGPNAGCVTPDNGTLSHTVFSHSAAHSPNVNNPPFFVDLPFEVDENNKPLFVAGNFTIANTQNGERIPIDKSLIPREDVIERWRNNDPFLFMDQFIDTLKKQAIYVDGGDTELINARGERALSDKLASLGIDHEFILYNGSHTACLTTPICARHRTMFQLFSAKFAEAGNNFPDDTRTKIVGIGTVCLEDAATLQINNGACMGIETCVENVTETDITFIIKNQASITIGGNNMLNGIARGCLQIGNRFSKARLKGNLALQNNEVRATIIVNGSDARLEIAEGGLLGLGAGINGQSPDIPNQWSLSSLTNVESICIDIKNGSFIHNNIASGQNPNAALIAIGPSSFYKFKIDPENANMLGGGNVVGMRDSWYDHPVALDSVGLKRPGGIRNNLETDPNLNDFFYRRPMSSTIFYTNNNDIGMFNPSGMLDNDPEPTANPFEINTTLIEEFCTFVAYDENDTIGVSASKEAPITSLNGELCLAFIDNNRNIIRVQEDQIPIGATQVIDLERIQRQHGYVDVVIREINDVPTVIRVDDPEPVA